MEVLCFPKISQSWVFSKFVCTNFLISGKLATFLGGNKKCADIVTSFPLKWKIGKLNSAAMLRSANREFAGLDLCGPGFDANR